MAYWIDQARNRRRCVSRAGECTRAFNGFMAVKTELVVLRVVIFVVWDGPVAQTFRVKVKRSEVVTNFCTEYYPTSLHF